MIHCGVEVFGMMLVQQWRVPPSTLPPIRKLKERLPANAWIDATESMAEMRVLGQSILTGDGLRSVWMSVVESIKLVSCCRCFPGDLGEERGVLYSRAVHFSTWLLLIQTACP